jgi:hypothetical protein
MGIYRAKKECGCIFESTTYDPNSKEYAVHLCVKHGGTILAQSALAAKEWRGPDNPYADPPQSTTSAPSTLSQG